MEDDERKDIVKAVKESRGDDFYHKTMSNKQAKKELIKRYGSECFIEKLHLRKGGKKKKRYTCKEQMYKMRQLTYHHIVKRENGGETTLDNGALLSRENHAWFHEQSKERQEALDQAFQLYKLAVDVATFDTNGKITAKELDFDLDDAIEIPAYEISDKEKNRKIKKKNEELKKEWKKSHEIER